MFDLILISCGLTLLFLTYSAASYKLMIPGRAPMAVVRRIRDINLSEKELEEKYRPLHEKILGPLAAWLVGSIKLHKLSKMELEEKLSMAGINKTAEEFITKQVATGLAFFLFGLLFTAISGFSALILFALILAAVGYIMPVKDLEAKIAYRKNQIIIELPDFLDMLVLSLRAGRNLYSAVKKASEHSGPYLRPLLEKLQADIELLDNKKDALWEFAEKTGVQEVKDFISALEIGLDARAKQAEEIYRSQSKIMRDLRALALRRYTKKIPGKLRFIQLWVYFNCIAIPIIAAITQFSAMFF